MDPYLHFSEVASMVNSLPSDEFSTVEIIAATFSLKFPARDPAHNPKLRRSVRNSARRHLESMAAYGYLERLSIGGKGTSGANRYRRTCSVPHVPGTRPQVDRAPRSSPRVDSVRELLSDGQWHSYKDMSSRSGLSESKIRYALTAMGGQVEKKCAPTVRKRYLYRLVQA